MDRTFSTANFNTAFPNDDACLDEIRRIKYSGGIFCSNCERVTKHYKLNKRPVFECKFCRKQTYPLVGTIFEKSTTPLKLWFWAMFLMTHTRANISAKTLQKELGVTYKTAWRIHKQIYKLMERNKGDLLSDTSERKWLFFNAIELKVIRKSTE